MTEKRIQSLKYDKGKVEMSGVETWGSGNERTWKLICYEEPAPELPAALKALEKHVRELLELPNDWADGSFRVVKVSWSYSESTGVQGASVTCLVDLEAANSPLVLNTPHLPYEQYSSTGNQPTMPNQMREALDKVEEEAEAYLRGKRSQGDLFGKAQVKKEPTEELTEKVTAVVAAAIDRAQAETTLQA